MLGQSMLNNFILDPITHFQKHLSSHTPLYPARTMP